MKFRLLLPLLISFGCFAASNQVHLIVTAEGHGGSAPPLLNKDQVTVLVDKKSEPVEDWVALRGAEANLELYLVIDDGTSSELALQYGEIKDFVAAQPSTTHVGLAYLSNGEARIALAPTVDRAAFAKALRVPFAQPGIAASPYMGVADLVKKWPASDARHEILLISSGLDPWGDNDPQNIYLRRAISVAQRSGVVVHSFSYGSRFWGQTYLAELCDETGGEFYWQGNRNPVSFIPWLKDLKLRLENQYLLTFDSPSGSVKATASGVSLETASRITTGR
jgi:hypothetical protein